MRTEILGTEIRSEMAGVIEVYRQPLYATAIYPADGARELEWFDKNMGTTAWGDNDTNMLTSDMLPGGREMLVTGIALGLRYHRTEHSVEKLSDQVRNEWAEAARWGTFRFSVSDKLYHECPADAIPVMEPGQSPDVEEIVTVVAGKDQVVKRRLMFVGRALDPGIHIQQYRAFRADMRWHAQAVRPVTQAIGLRLYLIGWQLRQIQ